MSNIEFLKSQSLKELEDAFPETSRGSLQINVLYKLFDPILALLVIYDPNRDYSALTVNEYHMLKAHLDDKVTKRIEQYISFYRSSLVPNEDARLFSFMERNQLRPINHWLRVTKYVNKILGQKLSEDGVKAMLQKDREYFEASEQIHSYEDKNSSREDITSTPRDIAGHASEESIRDITSAPGDVDDDKPGM